MSNTKKLLIICALLHSEVPSLECSLMYNSAMLDKMREGVVLLGPGQPGVMLADLHLSLAVGEARGHLRP